MGEAVVGNSVAAEDNAHSEVVVKVTARHSAGDFIDVLESRLSANIDYLGTSKTLLVESLRSQKTGEVLAELAEELNRIRAMKTPLPRGTMGEMMAMCKATCGYTDVRVYPSFNRVVKFRRSRLRS